MLSISTEGRHALPWVFGSCIRLALVAIPFPFCLLSFQSIATLLLVREFWSFNEYGKVEKGNSKFGDCLAGLCIF